MSDEQILYLILTGAITPTILADKLNITDIEAQSIFMDLENRNLIYLKKIPIKVLGKLTPEYKIQYALTEYGMDMIEI